MHKLSTKQRTKCEIWTRVMGYHRPVSSWNKGKQSEFKDRQYFSGDKAVSHARVEDLKQYILGGEMMSDSKPD